jgi:signal transduction histidine kinase
VRPEAYDLMLGVTLVAIGQWQIHSPDPHRVIAHKLFSAIVWGLTGTALAWRRRAPWAVFTIVVLGITVEALPTPDSGTLAGFVALCVVLYTVARMDRSIEKTVAASAVAIVALLFHYARDPMASNAVESIQATYVVLLGAAVGGRLVASREVQRIDEVEAQLRREADAALIAATEERARIARELHDVIAHSVMVALVQAMAAQAAIADGILDEASRRVAAIEDTARQALADMRRLVMFDADGDEMEPAPQPGLSQLPDLVTQLVKAGADVHLDMDHPPRAVPPGADLALFRIAQEALTNAINHAPGAAVRIGVRSMGADVELDVVNGPPTGEDRGRGSGRGLVGMRQRVELYGGRVVSGPVPDGGFRVTATLPVATVWT